MIARATIPASMSVLNFVFVFGWMLVVLYSALFEFYKLIHNIRNMIR